MPQTAVQQPKATVTLYVPATQVRAYAFRLQEISCARHVKEACQLDTQTIVYSALDQDKPDALRGMLGLLSGEFDIVNDYARSEGAAWLLDMAHSTCGPEQPRGRLEVLNASTGQWEPVLPTDALRAANYVYRLPVPYIGLTRICKSFGIETRHSTFYGTPDHMRKLVMERDKGCFISGSPCFPQYESLFICSHLVPVRLGDHVSRGILKQFGRAFHADSSDGDEASSSDGSSDCSSSPTTGSDSDSGDSYVDEEENVFRPGFGILLNASLDKMIDFFHLGLRQAEACPQLFTLTILMIRQGDDGYVAHDFMLRVEDIRFDVNGAMVKGLPDRPLHGQVVKRKGPFPAAVRWHYLQCVLTRFAHDDYIRMPHIYH